MKKQHEEKDEKVQDSKEEIISQDEESAECKKQIEKLEEKFRRALADYQNLEKRVLEEKSDWIRSANKELLLRLLPVLDTLQLAGQHVKDHGLSVSTNLFLDALKSEGVIKIETVGKIFDPSIMECITIEEGEDGEVLEEVRAGYLLYDKLLRPAQVKVGSVKQNKD